MKKNSIQEEILEMSTYSIPMSVQSEKSVVCFVLLSILRNFDVVENTHARKTTNKFVFSLAISYFCRMMRKYRFLFVIVLFIGVVVALVTCSIPSKSQEGEEEMAGFYDADAAARIPETAITEEVLLDIDIPLPLKGVAEQILFRKNYIVSYNKEYKIPNWVAWHLTAEQTNGDVKRPGNAWHEDTDVPLPRATREDYRGTNWTHGHMCPAGDNKWDSEAMYNTFLLTNCCPQHGKLNSGVWNQIEMSCRRWAERFGDIYIVCGPILMRQEHETIGENQVVVPEAFFKVIVCLNDHPKGIGFVCRNTEGNQKKDFYVNSIREVERITGMTFFPHLPKKVAEKVKNGRDLEEWK